MNKILHIFSDWKENKLKLTKLKKLMVDGNITDDPRNIAKFFAKFYSDLYTSKLSPKHMNYFFRRAKCAVLGGLQEHGWEPLLYSIFKAWFCMEPYKNVLLLLQAEEPFSGTV